jgi:integrase
MTKRVTTEQKNTTGRVGAEVIPIASRPTGEARMTIAAPTWILSGSFKVRGLLCLDGAFANGEPADTLSMGDVLTRIGGVDAATRSASWVWRDDRDGAVVDDSALGDAALVSTSGLRVPLALVPKVIGHGVTREMLTAVGAMAPEGGGSVSSGRAAAYTTKALLGDYLAARTARGRAGATLLYIQKHSKTLLRLLPELARDIGHERLLSYIATRIAEGAGEVIRKELHSVLRPSLKLAYKSDLFGVDPVKVIPEIDNKSVPGERWLTAAEVWGVALYFIDRGAPHRAALTIYAAALGADYAAWSRARHADVRDDLRGARVRGSKRKTRDRLAPTPLPEQKSMLRWAVANADGGPDGALFSAWANARRDLTTACEALGIPSCSPNDLRRTYSTWLAMAGIRNDLIDLALGHAPRTVLEKHYVKRTDDDLLRQMEAEYERHKVRPDEPPSTPSAPRGSNAAPPTPPPAATAARIENPRVGGSIPSLGTRTRGISARYRRAAGVGPPRRTRKYVSAGRLGSAWSRTLLPCVRARRVGWGYRGG